MTRLGMSIGFAVILPVAMPSRDEDPLEWIV
jgi:hypothetical protein